MPKRVLYTVIDKDTGETLCENARPADASRMMGYAKTEVSRIKRQIDAGKPSKWIITTTAAKGAETAHRALYSVWNNYTDECVGIDMTSDQAMKAMGLCSMNSFKSTVSKNRKGIRSKWTIELTRVGEEDDFDDDDWDE